MIELVSCGDRKCADEGSAAGWVGWGGVVSIILCVLGVLCPCGGMVAMDTNVLT